MQQEKPHPLLLIVFLLGISALISGWESLAAHRKAPEPKKDSAEIVRSSVKPLAQVRDTTVLTIDTFK